MRAIRLLCCVPLVAACAALVVGEDKSGPSQDYLQQRAQLEEMLKSSAALGGGEARARDVEQYELSFQPIALDRILVQGRLEQPQVFHYLTFRLRNQIPEDSQQLAAKATRYNQILQTIANQYESAKVENNVTLTVAGDAVLDRQDMRSRNRKVNITVLAYDENGSRMRLLEEPIGTGPQENFNVPDYGDSTLGSSFDQVRDAIEEKVHRRLRSVDEIRKLDLPPYNPQKVDEEGVAEGEVFGVLVFNRLSVTGDRFTFEVRGLSNKVRIVTPPAAKGQIDNYLAMRVLRRVYVIHAERQGDEFYEDLHPFTLTKTGWEWVNTFQRLEHRQDIAQVRYFLDNVADDQGKPNAQIQTEFWPYYGKVREARPNVPADKLPDLEKTLNER